MGEAGIGAAETERRVVVGPDERRWRLDRALAALCPDFSRARIQALVREGAVTLDGTVVSDPARRVDEGACLGLVPPPATAPEPLGEALPLRIVYEDDDLLVVDKEAGMVVHPAPGHEGGTLVNALIAHCGDSLSGVGGVRRPGIVHRLDRDTSGLLVVAKNDVAHAGLCAQFAVHGRDGALERCYRALVWGRPEPSTGSVRANLARSQRNREKIAVVRAGSGREAVTHYRVERAFGAEALVSEVACVLETGRTHQIRVHLTHIGHPLLGDPLYGTALRTKAAKLSPEARAALDALDRQALHAALLGFRHPRTGERLRFESPLPPAMTAVLDALQAMPR